jgi:hypothetical protein
MRISGMSSSEEFLDKSPRFFEPDEAARLLLIVETMKWYNNYQQCKVKNRGQDREVKREQDEY